MGLQRKKTKLGKDSDLDECLYKLFLIKRSEGVPLSGPILQTQAVKFHHVLHGNNDFNSSDGWFSKWRSRHEITQHSIEGQARSCGSESAALFSERLKRIMIDHGLNDNKCGVKMSQDRIDLFFAVSKSGSHKLKSRSPRCFKLVNMSSLTISYKNTKHAWMIGKIFTKSLFRMSEIICPAHPPSSYSYPDKSSPLEIW